MYVTLYYITLHVVLCFDVLKVFVTLVGKVRHLHMIS